jgi:hypothetical protein
MTMRAFPRALGTLLLLGLLGWFPASAVTATTPAVSVAPQAGVPGTPFAVLGVGFTPQVWQAVAITRAGAMVAILTTQADSNGRVALTIDSTGYAPDAGYTIAIGGASAASAPFAVTTGQSERCFLAETGFCMRGRFRAYWEAHGGLMRNGYPLTDELNEVLEDGRPYAVQYFERTRLEYHPEVRDPAAQVLVGQFGRRIHPLDPSAIPDAAQIWFPQTGHNVPTDFYRYWSDRGGLEQFGLPLTEPFMQRLEDGKTYLVQYFERARFEWHPENPAPYAILLGQFGRLVLPGGQR